MLRQCSSNEFMCKTNSKCIPRSSVCDLIDDCGDRSDEVQCRYRNDWDSVRAKKDDHSAAKIIGLFFVLIAAHLHYNYTHTTTIHCLLLWRCHIPLRSVFFYFSLANTNIKQTKLISFGTTINKICHTYMKTICFYKKKNRPLLQK